MISQKLAKELYDNDWPNSSDWFGKGWSIREEAHLPDLETLIEACGDGLFRLWNKEHSVWWNCQWSKDDQLKTGDGKTPQEAVANLYLALNKKD